MSHDHRDTDFITLMYAGQLDEITAVYLDGASEVLIREGSPGVRYGMEPWGQAKELIEVDGPLTEQEFTEIAQRNGALDNKLGNMNGSEVGYMALSDTGPIIARSSNWGGYHIADGPMGQGGPNWLGLGYHAPGMDFHDTAAEEFNLYFAHRRREANPEVLQNVAEWLGADVVEYLAAAKSPDAATEPHPLAVSRHPGLQPGNASNLPAIPRTTWRP